MAVKDRKGMYSQQTYTRRYCLVRSGKASWYRPPLMSVEDAIARAGL